MQSTPSALSVRFSYRSAAMRAPDDVRGPVPYLLSISVSLVAGQGSHRRNSLPRGCPIRRRDP